MTPRMRNQAAITGPNTVETRAVPKRCTMNSPIRITTVIGTTQGVRRGSTTSRPSTAESTEMAGVMIASPRNSAPPTMPRPRIQAGRLAKALLASVISDSVPPSPLLSARSTKTTYLTVTTMVSAQTISDSRPSTSFSDGEPPAACSASRNA